MTESGLHQQVSLGAGVFHHFWTFVHPKGESGNSCTRGSTKNALGERGVFHPVLATGEPVPSWCEVQERAVGGRVGGQGLERFLCRCEHHPCEHTPAQATDLDKMLNVPSQGSSHSPGHHSPSQAQGHGRGQEVPEAPGLLSPNS